MIRINGKDYRFIREALEDNKISKPLYYRVRKYYNSDEDAINSLIKAKKEKEEAKKTEEYRNKVIEEAGISISSYLRYEDMGDTPEEVVAYILECRKQRAEKHEIREYCKKKGVSFSRYEKAKDDKEFKDMTYYEIIDLLSDKKKANHLEPVIIEGVEYPSVRAAREAFGISLSLYDSIRADSNSAQEAIEKAIEKNSKNNKKQRGRKGKSIVVAGRKFDYVSDFCEYMNISTKSLYDRKRRFNYESVEECANDYYNLVKQAGGTKEKKNFHKLSVTVNDVVYKGLEDFLEKNNIKKKDFTLIKETYYPELPLDKWYIVARKYDKLCEKYKNDSRKIIKGKKYSKIKEVCEEYGISRTQLYWYRDTYHPGADAWDIIEKYIDFKEERN